MHSSPVIFPPLSIFAPDDRGQAFITTRHGGHSNAPFHSFNLGLHVNDNVEDVLKNRHQLAQHLNVANSNVVYMNQVHGNRVEMIDSVVDGYIPECDAMITTLKDVVLMVLVADCVPIVFADSQQSVIAVAHAGWRGTVQQITAEVLTKMQHECHCNLSDIKVMLGPSIGCCCYKIGAEVVDNVNRSIPFASDSIINRNGDLYLDLHLANRQVLIHHGVPDNNIITESKCVACNNQQWFSYRASGGVTGRFGMGIYMKG